MADRARFQRTDNLIRETFLDLMKKKGFQKITVSILIEEAGLNRSTFYLHYVDKYELLDTIEQELLDEVKEIMQSMLTSLETTQNMEITEQAATFIEERKSLFTILGGPKGDPEFIKRYAENLLSFILENQLLEFDDNVKSEYAKSALLGMYSGMFSTWIERGFEESPEQYVRTVVAVLTQVSEKARTIFGEE